MVIIFFPRLGTSPNIYWSPGHPLTILSCIGKSWLLALLLPLLGSCVCFFPTTGSFSIYFPLLDLGLNFFNLLVGTGSQYFLYRRTHYFFCWAFGHLSPFEHPWPSLNYISFTSIPVHMPSFLSGIHVLFSPLPCNFFLDPWWNARSLPNKNYLYIILYTLSLPSLFICTPDHLFYITIKTIF